ncbi:hypothetical protein C8Q75DRAFT_118339 [Abortiporus biennis]|nr:hypothetical protein C8Q75DRAFT_118339 [Abortiporus biennis]
MHETRRLLEAAAALSQLLRSAGVPHAFHVEGGSVHPFRRVRQACAGNPDVTTTPSPWTNRLHAVYHRFIPSIEIEILPSGEEGPRHLDSSTVTTIAGLPFLTISEFIRAKLKAWSLRRVELDAQDIVYILGRYWDRVDINRIPEQDMKEFVSRYPAAAPAWREVRRKYGGSKILK